MAGARCSICNAHTWDPIKEVERDYCSTCWDEHCVHCGRSAEEHVELTARITVDDKPVFRITYKCPYDSTTLLTPRQQYARNQQL